MYDLHLLAAIKAIAQVQTAHHIALIKLASALPDGLDSSVMDSATRGINGLDKFLSCLIDPEQLSSLEEELKKAQG